MNQDPGTDRRVVPRGPWVLARRLEADERSAGGIYKPQGNQEERLGHARAEVLATGPGMRGKRDRLIPMSVTPGQVVIFRGFLSEANRPFELDDRGLFLIHMKDIEAVDERGSTRVGS